MAILALVLGLLTLSLAIALYAIAARLAEIRDELQRRRGGAAVIRPDLVAQLRRLYLEHDELESSLVEIKRQGGEHRLIWTLTWRLHDRLERQIIDAQAQASPEEREAAEGPEWAGPTPG